MRKIANTSELQTELRQVLAYAQSELPSRARIARDLERLGRRLTAGGFGDATGDTVDSKKRHGEFNVIIRRDRPTRWAFTVENPGGGSQGSGSYTNAKRALGAAIAGHSEVKALDKVWVIIAEWSDAMEDFAVQKAYWQKLPLV